MKVIFGTKYIEYYNFLAPLVKDGDLKVRFDERWYDYAIEHMTPEVEETLTNLKLIEEREDVRYNVSGLDGAQQHTCQHARCGSDCVGMGCHSGSMGHTVVDTGRGKATKGGGVGD